MLCVAQAGPEFTLEPKMTLDSCSSCLYLPHAESAVLCWVGPSFVGGTCWGSLYTEGTAASSSFSETPNPQPQLWGHGLLFAEIQGQGSGGVGRVLKRTQVEAGTGRAGLNPSITFPTLGGAQWASGSGGPWA